MDISTSTSLRNVGEWESVPAIKWLMVYCIIIWLGYRLFIYPCFLSPLRFLPQPKGGYPFIGHALARFEQPVGQRYLRFMKEVPNHGLILFRDLFNTDHLLLANTNALAEVLVEKCYHFEKESALRQFMSQTLGGGILTVEGDVHKQQRRIISPKFTLRHTRSLAPVFRSKSLQMVYQIMNLLSVQNSQGRISKSGVVDMNVWATKITLDIFGLSGLGVDLQALSDSENAIEDAYKEILEPTPGKSLLYAALCCGFRGSIDCMPWNIDKRLTAITNYLRIFCWDLIQERKNDKTINSKKDLLSKILETGNFSDTSLVDHFLNFFAAGHETTAATFGWAIYLLATSPSIQSDLRQEIHSHRPPEQGGQAAAPAAFPKTENHLETLPLLNGVCNEALRLYPTIRLMPRVANQDTSILGFPVPKGTRVMVAPAAINRAPHLWGPQAEHFLPDRWIDKQSGVLNTRGSADSPLANLTFLHGPRSCIGSGYAKAEIREMLAAFISAFEVELANPNDEIIPRGRLIARPGNKEGKLMVKVKSVQTWR